jgi:hypothetical protein
VVRELVQSECLSPVCLQETKLDVINDFDVMQILGPRFDYVYLLVFHTRGGILVAWKGAVWSVSSASTGTFSVSIRIKLAFRGPEWGLISVFGPANDAGKSSFLAKLQDLRVVRRGAWLINGDFNLIYRSVDKNNVWVNHQQMGQFRHFLIDAQLKECHLEGRLYNWSNERVHPTLERKDLMFFSNEWEAIHWRPVVLTMLCWF